MRWSACQTSVNNCRAKLRQQVTVSKLKKGQFKKGSKWKMEPPTGTRASDLSFFFLKIGSSTQLLILKESHITD